MEQCAAAHTCTEGKTCSLSSRREKTERHQLWVVLCVCAVCRVVGR